MKNTNSKNAFSLLEMSIALTIISLLIAAVLAGQGLKHRQELSQIITDISSITSAVTQFKSAYGFYPGDLSTASTAFTVTGAGILNGNGSGYLDPAFTYNEELLFWYHLTASGLLSPSISGSYDGTTVTGDGGVMKSGIPYGLYQIHKAVNIPSAAVNPTGKMVVQISKAGGYGSFSTKEAYDYDAKYDNNNPVGTSGTITAADGTDDTGNCINSNAYKLTNTGGTPCVLYFYIE